MCTVHDDKPELGRLPLVREVLKAPLPSSPTPSTVSSSPRTLPWPLPAWPLGWQFVGFPACLGGAALSTWLAIRRFSGLLGGAALRNRAAGKPNRRKAPYRTWGLGPGYARMPKACSPTTGDDRQDDGWPRLTVRSPPRKMMGAKT